MSNSTIVELVEEEIDFVNGGAVSSEAGEIKSRYLSVRPEGTKVAQ